MKYSDITLKVLAAKECGIIKSNAQFWNDFNEIEKFETAISKDSNFDNTIIKLRNELISSDNYEEGIISVYDESFPVINKKVKNKGDKPYLLFYKGNLELLDDLNNNIAVIGLIDPDKNIAKRESDVVEKLIDNDLVIVSGLAAGCDSIAHKLCLEMGGKTIAVLPSQLNKIYPAENKKLAEDIVQKGGLLISEYYKDQKQNLKQLIDLFKEIDYKLCFLKLLY
ncbi:DNA-processing protein DprA [Clostridium perfringens]|nr:DNA-processing protein DprA [Clostridium perfringens]